MKSCKRGIESPQCTPSPAAGPEEPVSEPGSSQASDEFGAGNKFISPTIADGMVFVGTPNGVAVFGER